MSEGDFHVHGPHDHQLEHAAQHGESDRFAGRTAIKKTEASDQWNYYQAKSNKQNLAELAVELATTSEKQELHRQEVVRYGNEKEDIKVVADRLEAEAKDWDQRSEAELHLHHRWAQATTALQIAIALSAIALLTRRNWLVWGVYGVAGLGAALGAMALAHI